MIICNYVKEKKKKLPFKRKIHPIGSCIQDAGFVVKRKEDVTIGDAVAQVSLLHF